MSTGNIEDMPYIQIATLPSVEELGDGWPVEIWMNGKGMLFIRAYNESGHSSTNVELFRLLDAMKLDKAKL